MWMGGTGLPILGVEVGPCWVGAGVPAAGQVVGKTWEVEVVLGMPLEVVGCLGVALRVALGLGLGAAGG